jgi:hypothetical protein
MMKNVIRDLLTFLGRLKMGFSSAVGQAAAKPKNATILGTHWKRLPNVKNFVVKVNGLNSIFQYFGIKKMNRPDITWTPYRNIKYNIYMEKQIRRLRKYKSNPKVFFRIAWFLITKSKVFRVSAINKTLYNWYKRLPFGEVMRINRKVNKILNTADTHLDFRRVYIPKGDSDWRPLGVPTPEWRVVLQLVNNFLYIFLEDKFLPSQHGFIPGKGTLTAWKEVMTIQKAKYIFEYDLEKYFDSVNIVKIMSYLEDLGVPYPLVIWMEQVHISTPQLPQDEKLDESEIHLNEERKRMFSNPNYFTFDSELMGHQILPKGVPQGSNTGPLLSLIPLIKFLSQQKSVSYADDGLFYSDEPFEVKDLPEWGVKFNKNKTGWVKKDGKWLKPLKFLGLLWDGTSLRASTRKGSTLVADGYKTAFSFLSSDKLKLAKNVYDMSWEHIFKANFGGTLISKLYNGTWNMEDALRNIRFNVSRRSVLKGQKNVNFYNASSYASYTLIRILSNE